MALKKQVLSLSFEKGLNQKASDRVLNLPFLADVKNGRMEKTGEIRRRAGIEPLQNSNVPNNVKYDEDLTPGTNFTNVSKIATRDKELLMFDDHKLYGLMESTNKYSDKGVCDSVTMKNDVFRDERGLIQSRPEMARIDDASNGNWICAVWYQIDATYQTATTAGSNFSQYRVYAQLYDADTMSQVGKKQLIAYSSFQTLGSNYEDERAYLAPKPRVLASGTRFVIFYNKVMGANNTLKYRMINIDSSPVATSEKPSGSSSFRDIGSFACWDACTFTRDGADDGIAIFSRLDVAIDDYSYSLTEAKIDTSDDSLTSTGMRSPYYIGNATAVQTLHDYSKEDPNPMGVFVRHHKPNAASNTSACYTIGFNHYHSGTSTVRARLALIDASGSSLSLTGSIIEGDDNEPLLNGSAVLDPSASPSTDVRVYYVSETRDSIHKVNKTTLRTVKFTISSGNALQYEVAYNTGLNSDPWVYEGHIYFMGSECVAPLARTSHTASKLNFGAGATYIFRDFLLNTPAAKNYRRDRCVPVAKTTTGDVAVNPYINFYTLNKSFLDVTAVTALSGTFKATNSSTAITEGSSTAFTTQVQVGDRITIGSEGTYTVDEITSDTALTLTSNFTGSTAAGKSGTTDEPECELASHMYYGCAAVIPGRYDDEKLIGSNQWSVMLTSDSATFSPSIVTVSHKPYRSLPSVEHNNSLLVGGGYLKSYDGFQCHENGFFRAPQIAEVTGGTGTAFGAVGRIKTGTYQYKAIYEYVDSAGNLHRSTVSDPITKEITAGSDNGYFFVEVYTCNHSLRYYQDVRVVLYRTTLDQSTYYRIGSMRNNWDDEKVKFLDTYRDIDIFPTDNPQAAHEPLYLYNEKNVGSLGSVTDIAIHKNRVMLATTDNRVHACKPSARLYATEVFSDVEFQFGEVESGTEKVYGIQSTGQHLLVFTNNNLYAISGEGPDANGETARFTDPMLLRASRAAIEGTVHANTPAGVIYQSARGFYLANKELQIDYIGAPVEDLSTYRALGTAIDDSKNEVYFALGYKHDENDTSNDAAGHEIVLVYNYLFKSWTQYTYDKSYVGYNSGGLSMHAGRLHLGRSRYAYYHGRTLSEDVDSTVIGGIWRENEDKFWDSKYGTSGDIYSKYLTVIETPYIYTNKLQGAQRVYKAQFLGDYKGDHDITVEMTVDYDESSTHSQTKTASTLTDKNIYQIPVKRQKNRAIKIKHTVTPNASSTISNEMFRLDGIALEVGFRPTTFALPKGDTI